MLLNVHVGDEAATSLSFVPPLFSNSIFQRKSRRRRAKKKLKFRNLIKGGKFLENLSG